MGRGQGTLEAIAVVSQARQPHRLHLSLDNLVRTSEVNFSYNLRTTSEDYWNAETRPDADTFRANVTIENPILPWKVADSILSAYQIKAKEQYEKGLRERNPRSRKKAPAVEVTSLDELAVRAIVESQQLTSDDFNIIVSNGYYGPEVDRITLDRIPAANIDLLTQAYFGLATDLERLAFIVEGAEGETPDTLLVDEHEPAPTIEAQNVPYRLISTSTDIGQNEIRAAWARQGSSNAYSQIDADEEWRYDDNSVFKAPLAVVTEDAGRYQVIYGASHLRGLDPDKWRRKSVPVIIVS